MRKTVENTYQKAMDNGVTGVEDAFSALPPEDMLKNFAKTNNIDVGIVVGRLQKEGYIPYNRYNDLKTKYCIS